MSKNNDPATSEPILLIPPVSALSWQTVLFWMCGIGFLALTFWAASGRYLPGEQDLVLTVVGNRIPVLNQPAQLISLLGSINIILPLWTVIVVFAARRRRSGDVLRLFVVPLGYPLYVIIKSGIGRPGPMPPQYPWLYDLPLGYYVEGLLRRQLQELPSQGIAVPVAPQPVTAQSVTQVMESGYVSGHALVAAIFYGSLALLLWRNVTPWSVRWLAAILLAILAALVGLVRIYMGIHFPSDVLGAWLLAILFLILSDKLTHVIMPRLTLARQRFKGHPADS
jgi:membrane-associated phospholipid phosphatase